MAAAYQNGPANNCQITTTATTNKMISHIG